MGSTADSRVSSIGVEGMTGEEMDEVMEVEETRRAMGATRAGVEGVAGMLDVEARADEVDAERLSSEGGVRAGSAGSAKWMGVEEYAR